MRKQFNDVMIGGNGCGKTTLMLKIVISYMESNPLKRTLFVLPDDNEEKLYNIEEIDLDQNDLLNFEGIKKIMLDSHKDFDFLIDTFKTIKDSFGNKVTRKFNGLWCCDDLGTIMNRRPEDILRLFRRRRQPNIDFLWSFHGLRTEVPPSFYTYVNRIYLFRTSDDHTFTMNQLAHDKREMFERAYFEVQQKSETNPHYCREIILNPLNI